MATLSDAIGNGIVAVIKDNTVLQGLFGGSGSSFRIDFPTDNIDSRHHNQNDMVLFYNTNSIVEEYNDSAKSIFSYSLMMHLMERQALSTNLKSVIGVMSHIFRKTNYSSTSLVAHMVDDTADNDDLLGNNIVAILNGPTIEVNRMTDPGSGDIHQAVLVYTIEVICDHTFPFTIS